MAETRVELNTGFTSGPEGLAKHSKIALNTSTPSAMPSEGIEGAIKRKVLEPDQFPSVGLDKTSPTREEYPNRGNKSMSDGKSKTA